MTEQTAPARYPVRLEVDYPETQSRWKALFRLFLAIPVLIFVALLTGGGGGAGEATRRGGEFAAAGTSGVIVAIWVTIVLRQRIPRWLFDFQAWVNRFTARAFGYLALLTDEYPAFEDDYPVRYEIDYPDRLSRWKVFVWKIITSIPHLFVLVVLYLTLVVVVPIAWFAILFTGRYPAGLHTYVVGVMRWGARVQAYLYSLTDAFPPFSLDADAGPGGQDSYRISAIVGVVAIVAIAAGVIAAFVIGGRGERVSIAYQDLLGGQSATAEVGNVSTTLSSGADPAGEPYSGVFRAKAEHRLVQFTLDVENQRNGDLRVKSGDFRLKDNDGEWHDPFLFEIDGRTRATDVEEDEGATVTLLFEMANDDDPDELRYELEGEFGPRTIVYEIE